MATASSPASSSPAADKLTLRNTGTRRVVLGPPAKSKSGSRAVTVLGTSDDAGVPADKRRDQVVVLEGEAAKALRDSTVFAAVKDRLGLQAA
jgi:hypothetical protein